MQKGKAFFAQCAKVITLFGMGLTRQKKVNLQGGNAKIVARHSTKIGR